MRSEQEAYTKLGIEHELVKELPVPVDCKLGLAMKNQAQFHPLLYGAALVKEIVKNGARIFEQTAAIDIKKNRTRKWSRKTDTASSAATLSALPTFLFMTEAGFMPPECMPADPTYSR